MKLLKPLVLGVFLSLLSLTGAVAAETLKIGHIAARTGFLKGPGLPATVAVDMAVEEIEGREFKTVIVFEFTEVPKSWPSLGVTDACQSSPRVISSLEIVNNPSNCV